ncbi:MAG: hypothetical protein QF441_10495 [Bacteriovoracaceae bacterium]|jgi:hypothetical protein|nr:hypothetical protein [Halobacteriovoraceae bacterium]MDP7321029.1 hypothetical protein [Bacteriovoracaceae bacterium]|tara:strand:+ start:415 stop:618 length:204 start_codon:yes stop_codon:yes gene_type:complete
MSDFEKEKHYRAFIHELANDMMVIEGYIKQSLKTIGDQEDRALARSYSKAKEVCEKIRSFREFTSKE